jgi:hypothetical protein
MELVPGFIFALARDATPPVSVALPRVMFPVINVTLPVGVPDGEETVAVNVTACP